MLMIDRDLQYEDYLRIISAKSGDYDRRNRTEMALLQPYFQKGYLATDRTGESIWLTRKGVDVLLAVGCDPNNSREFFEQYPRMLDLMQ